MKSEEHQYYLKKMWKCSCEDLVHTSVVFNLDWSEVKKLKKWLDWRIYKTDKSSGSLYNIHRGKNCSNSDQEGGQIQIFRVFFIMLVY